MPGGAQWPEPWRGAAHMRFSEIQDVGSPCLRPRLTQSLARNKPFYWLIFNSLGRNSGRAGRVVLSPRVALPAGTSGGFSHTRGVLGPLRDAGRSLPGSAGFLPRRELRAGRVDTACLAVQPGELHRMTYAASDSQDRGPGQERWAHPSRGLSPATPALASRPTWSLGPSDSCVLSAPPQTVCRTVQTT